MLSGGQRRRLDMEVRRPTLDDVFLSLTGHALRDEPVEAATRSAGRA